MCFSCICLFVLYVLVLSFFFSTWCQGLAVVCNCGTLLRALHVFKSSRALCPRVFFILFSIVITSLGGEGAGQCASRAFVCLFYTC